MILLVAIFAVWLLAAVGTALTFGRTVRRADHEECAPSIPWDARRLETAQDLS